MTKLLEDSHIVVSGGTGALGTEIVKLLVEQGAHCWVPCFESELRDPSQSQRDHVHYVMNIDLSKSDDVHDFFSKMPSLWASIHVAGGFAMSSIAETTLADFERMWRMNTVSTFLSSQAAVERIRESKRGGRIVNVAARPAAEPCGGMLAYTTSKAGVASLTECLAKEVAEEGILVNAILPAIMDTPSNRSAMPDADHASWPKTSEIAHTVAFLASPQNSVTSGALLPVYGKLL